MALSVYAILGDVSSGGASLTWGMGLIACAGGEIQIRQDGDVNPSLTGCFRVSVNEMSGLQARALASARSSGP